MFCISSACWYNFNQIHKSISIQVIPINHAIMLPIAHTLYIFNTYATSKNKSTKTLVHSCSHRKWKHSMCYFIFFIFRFHCMNLVGIAQQMEEDENAEIRDIAWHSLLCLTTFPSSCCLFCHSYSVFRFVLVFHLFYCKIQFIRIRIRLL